MGQKANASSYRNIVAQWLLRYGMLVCLAQLEVLTGITSTHDSLELISYQ
jgi:hypothetical protein